MVSSTKEGTMALISEYATKIDGLIDPARWAEVTKLASDIKAEHEEKFGKMPELIPFSIEKWIEKWMDDAE
jgi:hypothetical protein